MNHKTLTNKAKEKQKRDAAICQAFKDGEAVKDIAVKFGVSGATVSKAIREAGVSKGRNGERKQISFYNPRDFKNSLAVGQRCTIKMMDYNNLSRKMKKQRSYVIKGLYPNCVHMIELVTDKQGNERETFSFSPSYGELYVYMHGGELHEKGDY